MNKYAIMIIIQYFRYIQEFFAQIQVVPRDCSFQWKQRGVTLILTLLHFLINPFRCFSSLYSPFLYFLTVKLSKLKKMVGDNCTYVSFTFCKHLVKFIYCCSFFILFFADIYFFVLLFCEKATPTLLVEIANCWLFFLYLLFRKIVKLVITKPVKIFLLFLS